MSFAGFMVHPVTRLRGTTSTDRYANSRIDWSTPTRLDFVAWIDQSDSTETIGDNRTMLRTATTMRIPADVDVADTDRFEIDGVVHEIDGKPKRAYTPRGLHHIAVRLKLVEG